MIHDWEAARELYDPRATVWVCKNCRMEVWSVQMPKREKVVAWDIFQGFAQKRRFSCEEYLYHSVMGS